ncbi:MAG: hypothetical protein K8T91_13040 [Planctomycetes bacterium]|nr:hypothetical protein [Planctomycetota bacterium]
MRSLRPWGIFVLASALIAGFAATAPAQQIELLAGEPFGVGQVIIPISDATGGDAWADGRVDVTDREGRIMYPVHATGPVRKLLREFIDAPPSMTILYLFTGRAPLDVTVHTPQPRTQRVTPINARPQRFNVLMNAWWRDFSRTAERHHRDGEYPALVEIYLAQTLARRLSLPAPRLEGGLLRGRTDQGLGLLMGTESMRMRIGQDALSGRAAGVGDAVQHLPEEVPLAAAQVAAPPADVKIEPIARHVPDDCFYLRCGTYANYVWFRSTLDEWGGDLRNLISQRGLDYEMTKHNERQLGLKFTVLSRTFGGTLISDVAIIGADPFFREGAAYGMLFEARNNLLLEKSLTQQRAEAMTAEKGRGIQRVVEIAGQKVQLLSTPDGEVRSYYSIVGNYHLVTTSEAITRRFIEIGKAEGRGSLGDSVEFKAARARMPLTRDDTLFVYLSEPFLRRIAGPHYRIEMARRLRSAVEIDCVRLARLAAAAEKKPASTIEELVAADMLPQGFGRRADGSKLEIERDRIVDSQRGTPGLFVPVPDMKVDQVTAAEATAYQQFARDWRDEAARLDPIVAAVKRFRTKTPGLERVQIDLSMTPLGGQYAWLMQYLGEPSDKKLATRAEDLVRIEGSGRGGNYIFLGIQDINVPAALSNGRIRLGLPALNMVSGYLGGSPTLGMFESLISLTQGGLTSPPDAAGYARHTGGLWQRSAPGMQIVSFKREILERVTPGMMLQGGAKPAQLRVTAPDLSNTKLAGSLNSLAYQRGMDISVGNAEMLQSLVRQLHVPREQALAVAETLVGAKLACPLGGTYVQLKDPNSSQAWASTAWSGDKQQAIAKVPADFVAPAMQWFRGLDMDMRISGQQRIDLHAEIGLQHKPAAAGGGFVLPGFSWLGGAKQDAPLPPPVEITPQIEELPLVEELPPPVPAPAPRRDPAPPPVPAPPTP